MHEVRPCPGIWRPLAGLVEFGAVEVGVAADVVPEGAVGLRSLDDEAVGRGGARHRAQPGGHAGAALDDLMEQCPERVVPDGGDERDGEPEVDEAAAGVGDASAEPDGQRPHLEEPAGVDAFGSRELRGEIEAQVSRDRHPRGTVPLGGCRAGCLGGYRGGCRAGVAHDHSLTQAAGWRRL